MRLSRALRRSVFLAAAALPLAADAAAAGDSPCSAAQRTALVRQSQALHVAPSTVGTFRDAACKAAPGAPGTTLAVVAWENAPDDPYTTPGLVAVLDDATGRAQAAAEIGFDDDADTHVQPGTLHLDTAPYLLAPGVRAFGVDVSHGGNGCPDAGTTRTRSLYVRDGATLRAVLSDLDLSSWRYLQGNEPRCTSAKEAAAAIVEDYEVTIAIDPKVTNGWHDLALTATAKREDGRPSARAPLHVRVAYDGKAYPLEAFRKTFERWKD